MSSSLDTLAGDIVVLQVPSDPPYGVTFGPDMNGNGLVIKSFEKLPTGKFGLIQKHGGIHYDDVLFEINDISLHNVSHRDALNMLLNSNTLKKILKFKNKKEYYRLNTRDATSLRATQPQFLSAIKVSRIAEDMKSKKFVEYEISCQFRVVGLKVHKEYVYQWSLWKRYSDFESLHATLKKSLGWRLDNIEFPSSSMFVLNKLAPEFIDQRREKLKDYWQKLIAIDKLTDFSKHHCSLELKAFLEVDLNTLNKEVLPNSDSIVEEPEENPSNNTTAASTSSTRRGSVRINSKRLSVKAISYDNNVTNTVSQPIESNSKSIQNTIPSKQLQNSDITNNINTTNSIATTETSVPVASASVSGNIPIPVQQQQPVDPRYAVYIKMKSMIPEGAVRQKMEADGFTSNEIKKFFQNTETITPPPPPPPRPISSNTAMNTTNSVISTNDNISNNVDSMRYAKYSKMKEMRIPDEAVKQKMMSDGFSSFEINQFFTGSKASMSSSTATNNNNNIPIKTPARSNLLDSINKLRKD